MGSSTAPITDPGPDKLTGIDPWPTLANALANSAVTAAANVAQWNANLLAQYQNTWSQWAQQVTGGWIDPATKPAPVPPPAWIVAVGAEGYSNPVISTTPICSVPPAPTGPTVPPVAPPNNVDIGNNIPVSGQPSHFWQVGPRDTWPIGKYTPPNAKSADGTEGSFLRLGAVVGAGWYEL